MMVWLQALGGYRQLVGLFTGTYNMLGFVLPMAGVLDCHRGEKPEARTRRCEALAAAS